MKKLIVALTENREIRMPNMMFNMPNSIFSLFASLYVRCFLVTSFDCIGRFCFEGFSKVRE